MGNDDRRIMRGLSVERHIRNLGPLPVDAETIEVLRAQAPVDPADAAERFLLNLAVTSSESGIMTALDIDMARGMAFTDALDSVYANLNFLKDAGWIDFHGDRFRQPDTSFRLTLAGWKRVRQLKASGQEGDVGFVAMSFNRRFDDLYDHAIRPAIEEAGWRPVRADKTQYSSRIDDWIMNQISGARFVVADTTLENPGAMLEAGYALGLGRPVIWTARDSWMDRGLHFDIRQYNHLPWKRGKEGERLKGLTERIIAVVGKGPHA